MLHNILVNINSDRTIPFEVIRAIIIYIYAIFLIRISDKRFHFETTIDFILVIIIGSIFGRAVNGSSSLLEAMITTALLFFLHWLFAFFSFRHHSFGLLIKGKPEVLIHEGQILWENLKKNQITEEDLREMCREKLNHDMLNQIKIARLERTGKISFTNYNQ